MLAVGCRPATHDAGAILISAANAAGSHSCNGYMLADVVQPSHAQLRDADRS
jgi:hypothetical protein